MEVSPVFTSTQSPGKHKADNFVWNGNKVDRTDKNFSDGDRKQLIFKNKQEKEYIKAVYRHPAQLTYMQSTS